MPYLKKKKTRKKKKNLPNWKERRKEKRKKKRTRTQQVKLVLKKPMIRGEHILNCTKSVKRQTQHVHSATNISIRNVFHSIIKSTYPKKKKNKIPMSVFSKQTFPLTWL